MSLGGETRNPADLTETINLTDLADVDTTGVGTSDFLQFNGSNWVDFDLLAANNTWTGTNKFDLGADMNSQKITNLADPINLQDGATRAFVEDFIRLNYNGVDPIIVAGLDILFNQDFNFVWTGTQTMTGETFYPTDKRAMFGNNTSTPDGEISSIDNGILLIEADNLIRFSIDGTAKGGISSTTFDVSNLGYTFAQVVVTTTPYNLGASDYFLLVSTASAKTINLPSALPDGRTIIIKDISNNAGTNNITITAQGKGADIDGGGATVTISTNNGVIRLIHGNGLSQWYTW